MTARPSILIVALAGLVGAGACGGARKTTRATGSYGSPAQVNAEADYGSAGSADYAPESRSYEPIGREQPQERPGLGTEFGEIRNSHVQERRFDRATSAPFASVALYYNDEEGVAAQIDSRGGVLQDVRAFTPNGGISVALTDGNGNILPGGDAGGRTYVVGRNGDRYTIILRNDTPGRFEVVASVDGLDVIDGHTAGYAKRGYILDPYSMLEIDGFRTSEDTVASFRFGRVSDSYAARTGNDRNVGVVGVAFFAERGSRWTTDEVMRRETADPFPNKYAQPPPGY